MAENRNFLISEELADDLLDYLSKRPYREVVKLIGGLATMIPQVVLAPEEQAPKVTKEDEETKLTPPLDHPST